jgi:aryl-alcohol dehydrogenase-like predicted oxidoreductase
VRAASEFASLAGQAAPDATPAQVALAWIARQSGVSTVIPGARNPEQARANAAAGSLELPDSFDAAVRDLYDREIRASVHHRW